MEDGSWVESKLKEPEEIINYSYYPQTKELRVDHSDYAPDGFCNICIEERFRIEHIRKNTCWLYLLEGVEIEPDDYYFKLKVRFE